MKPVEHIKKIQKDLDGSKRIKESLLNAIKALADELYSKDTHFIFELIQNAEDNSYNRDVEPSLTFRLLKNDFTKTNNSDGILIIENNEIGFKKENIDAICKVGGSTKKKSEGYIGEKGIGFKSVFKISSCPQIFSNSYSFALPEMDKNSNLGYIFPRWLDDIPSFIDKSKTTILLPLDKKNYSFQKITTFLKNIDIESILFLSKLSELKIEIEEDNSFSMIKDSSKFPFVDLLFEEKDCDIVLDEYFIINEIVTKPKSVFNEKRKDINQREITIALPLTKTQKRSKKLFAYLPVMEDTGLPFIINADFLLTSSREDIKIDESWNKWLRECISDVFVKGFEKGLLNKGVREKIYEFIPLQSKIVFFEPIILEIHNKLKNVKSILSAPDYNLILPINARFASKDFRILLNNNYPETLSDNMRIILPSLEKYKKQLQQIGVRQIMKEEIKEVFSDKKWVELHNSNWLLNCYKYLRKQKYEKGELFNLSLVPVSTSEKGNLILSCDDIQPIYFVCVAEAEESLKQISSKVNVQIEFVEKGFFKMIEEDDELQVWMTEILNVYDFSKENYSVDLYKWFVNKYHILSNKDFITLSFLIIEFSGENPDFPEFPLLLGDNKGRIKKSDLNQMANIQSIVTPTNYDIEKGWQNIWITEEDRKHLAILSNKYLVNDKESHFRKFSRINNIEEFPLPFYVEKINSWNGNDFERERAYQIHSTSIDGISNHRPSSSICNFDRFSEKQKIQISNSLSKWLIKSEKKIEGYTYKFEKNDWTLMWVDYFYYSQRSKKFDSEFLSCLKKNKWMKSTKGYIRSSEAFIKKQYILDIFGESLPYIEDKLPEKMIEKLGINSDISFEKVIELLESQKTKELVDLNLIRRIYKYLDNLYDSEKTQSYFRSKLLVFIPNCEDSNWFTSKDIFWSDKSDVFDDTFPYLEKHYPKLKSFFLETLSINDEIDAEKYAQQWIKIQEQESLSIDKIKISLSRIYKELLPLFRDEENFDWWDDFIEDAKIWTQNNQFINPDNVFVPDDIELKSAFKNENLNLMWRPNNYTNSDFEGLYNEFQIKYLSEEVDISIHKNENEIIDKVQFLTKSSKILILSWLYNKQENNYNHICENGLFDSLINTKEFCANTLEVCYKLEGLQVIKERDSFWLHKENKLFYIKNPSDLKNSMAQNIARTLLPTQKYKDFANFIELVISSTNWRKRLENNDFKLSKELKNWLKENDKLNENMIVEKKEVTDKIDSSANIETDTLQHNRPSDSTSAKFNDTEVNKQFDSKLSNSQKSKAAKINKIETQDNLNEELNANDENKDSDLNIQIDENSSFKNNQNFKKNESENINSSSLNVSYEFNNAFNKPNRNSFPSNFENDGNVENPNRRSENNWESLHNNTINVPDTTERFKTKKRRIFEEPDNQVREFLKQLYNGECQICGKTFRKKNDGSNYFNSTYIIPRKLKRQMDFQANALCLCPEHFAKFHNASAVADPPFVEQILSLKILAEGGDGNLSINLTLAGESCKITYKEKHLKDLQDMIEFYSNENKKEE